MESGERISWTKNASLGIYVDKVLSTATMCSTVAHTRRRPSSYRSKALPFEKFKDGKPSPPSNIANNSLVLLHQRLLRDSFNERLS